MAARSGRAGYPRVVSSIPEAGTLPAADPAGIGRCYRCGKPTGSPDIGLCDECNPTGIAGPTATQVHGLILASVAGAIIVVAIAAKILGTAAGPFPTAVVGQASYADGTVGVAIRIGNDGASTARPTCTIARGPDDSGTQFLADPIAPGSSVVVTKRFALPAGSSSADVTVDCR